MRTTSLLAAALLAATAVADQARPKIYFPRHVKRQFSNTTITSSSSLESQSSTPDLSLSAPKTLPRDESASESTNPRVTTIVVQSTIWVSPPAATGTANNTGSASSADTATTNPSTSKEDVTSKPPADEPLPSSPSSDAPSTDAPSSEAPKSDAPSTEAPKSDAPKSDAPKSDAPKSDAPKSDAPKSDAPQSDAPSSGGVPSSVVLPTTRPTSTSSQDTVPVSSEPPKPVESEDPSPSEPPLAANTTTSTEPPVSVAPTTTTTSTSGILLAPSGIVTTTSSAKDPLEPIESIISSILNPPKASNTTDPVPSQAPITTTSADIEPSLIPSLPPPIISEPPTSTSTADQPPVSSPIPGQSSATPDPQPESTTTPVPGESSTPPVSSVTPPPVSPIPEPSEPVDPPVSSNTTTSAGPPPSTTTSGGSVVTPPPDQPSEASSAPLPPPPVTLNSTTSANNTVPQVTPPTTVPTSLPPTTTPQTTTPPSDDVTSVPPLSTITGGTEGWATPTAIIVDDASTTVSGIIAPTSGSGIPTALPKAINPDTFGEPQPEDTTLIQIGFLNSLNYPFVSQNNQAAYQIFRLLPQALAYGSNFDLSKCRVMKLIPLDTRPSLGYLTTLAIASYPSNLIDALQMDIRLANSALYASGQPIVQNLTMQINSAIDITLGAGYGGGPGWDTGIPADPTDGPTDPFGGEGNANNQTSAEKGATAGIVAGSVGIAAAYGAAMFIIARRYKRKKQAHRRASSISNPSEMQYNGRGSPAMMGGALLSRDFSTYGATSGPAAGERNSHGSGRSGAGNSGRTAYISAPVAAENSLGWN